jgi:hypothetical protein
MKTILLNILVLLSLSLTTVTALAQQPIQDTLLGHMTGKWLLKGTIDGKETTHDIVTEWVLGHEYIQINEVSREKNADGKPVYDAIVYIGLNKDLTEYSCLWLDNTGSDGLNAHAIGHANRNGNKLEFLFKIAEKSIFHTTFVYNLQEDSWQWLMDDEENGKWQSFAKMKLTRE